MAETDFGSILSGRHPMGLLALFTGPVRLTANAQIGNEADRHHRHRQRFIGCCDARLDQTAR
ncbi:hypothetical protein J8I29_07835 [Labrys sp. LIt4]|uniref:hypothetical protein n=1 Tax=Labrys TaxID=204476 RepID=UPI0011B26461|nr:MULTISPECIES: hypothetical protein [Labrys]MBP0579211.1 hypothetical protein [Labrys sp. LIt4]